LKKKREEELKERVKGLNELTESLLTRVRELLGSRRIFGHAFVYDGMDYCKVVLQEMRQLKTILLSHGLDMIIPSEIAGLNSSYYQHPHLLDNQRIKNRTPSEYYL
jgi:hypothetical protein